MQSQAMKLLRRRPMEQPADPVISRPAEARERGRLRHLSHWRKGEVVEGGSFRQTERGACREAHSPTVTVCLVDA